MSTIKSSTTLTTAYSVEADTTGALVIQTGATPTTAVTVSSAQVVTLANALPVASGGTGLTSAGTAGNLLTSNGTTWVSQVASGATGDNILTANTSPGTWTKPATVKSIKVTVIGGGGNGGPVNTGPNGTGSGGGGGGASIIIYPAASLPGPQPYTVGTAGNTSSFGVAPVTVVSATGGAAGVVASSTAAGGLGGLGSGGTINMRGTGGDAGSNSGALVGNSGGSSFMGGGSEVKSGASSSTTQGAAGSQYGGGGGGSFKSTNPGPSTAGGAGATGVVIIEEFY